MKGLPAELVYILIFAAIVLFQLMTKKFAQQQQGPDTEPDAGLEEYPGDEVPGPAAALPVSAPGARPFGRTEAPMAIAASAPNPAKRRFSRRSLMRSRRDLQDAMVIAAIVGRCRADEPHDIR